MATASKFDMKVTVLSDTELKITREFDAPRDLEARRLLRRLGTLAA